MRDQFTQERARELRGKLSDAEQRLWKYLRRKFLHGHRFRRQVPIGPYIADFACLTAALIVEVDGGQHDAQRAYDEKRDAHLKSRGFRVLRFWANEVLAQTDAVVETILRELECPSAPSQPSPASGGRGRKDCSPL